jgi:uncharacterized protein
MLGYVDKMDVAYQNTRRFVLSPSNRYYMHGPALNATGGPHIGPGMAWPMGLIVQLLTSDDDAEIAAGLRQLVSSTNKLGLIHEAVNSQDASGWTRQWYVVPLPPPFSLFRVLSEVNWWAVADECLAFVLGLRGPMASLDK